MKTCPRLAVASVLFCLLVQERLDIGSLDIAQPKATEVREYVFVQDVPVEVLR